jgi:uncharacterized protein (DUF2249 family)
MVQGETRREISGHLDLRGVAPGERQALLRTAIDQLGAADQLRLVVDEDPRELLKALRAERNGFEWHVLEAKPGNFRFEVGRLMRGGPRTVSEHLAADHDRLDALFREARQLAVEGRFEDARARFDEFACGLSQHIDAEESVLFPAFEEKTGIRGGPTRVMRSEHIDIQAQLGAVSAAIGQRDRARFEGAASLLVEVLGAHNMKEEQMLYPMTDDAAGGDREREELVRLIEAV